MKSMQSADSLRIKYIGVDCWSFDAGQGPAFSARDNCIGVKILCDSYTGIVPTRSISYGSLASYPDEEAVMFGLLAALAGVVLMSLFIAYECLCGRL